MRGSRCLSMFEIPKRPGALKKPASSRVLMCPVDAPEPPDAPNTHLQHVLPRYLL